MQAVVIYSGGLDSTVLLYHVRYRVTPDVVALSFDYGQRHGQRELAAARAICKRLKITHRTADLSGLAGLFGKNALTCQGVPVPLVEYDAASMADTVVPNRNGVMLSLALAHAAARGADFVAYGAHAGDHTVYPDCRPEFADAMAEVGRLCHSHPIKLATPFVGWSKAQIVVHGATLDVPMAETWSCYQGGEVHCGQCGTCTERREAFRLAGVEDQTPYVAPRRNSQ